MIKEQLSQCFGGDLTLMGGGVHNAKVKSLHRRLPVGLGRNEIISTQLLMAVKGPLK